MSGSFIGWNKQSGVTIILDALQNSMTRSSTKEIRLKLAEIESLNSRQVKVIVGECCFPPDLLRKDLKSKIEHCNNMVRIMNIKLGLKSSLKLWKLGSRFKNDILVTLKVWGEDGYHFRKESGNLYCNFIRNSTPSGIGESR